MKKKKKSSAWWVILLIVLLAGLGYYLYTAFYHRGQKTTAPPGIASTGTGQGQLPMQEVHPSQNPSPASGLLAPQEVSSGGQTVPPANEPATAEEAKEGPIQVPAQTQISKSSQNNDPCTQVQNNIREFFQYLDKKQYVRRMHLGTDTYSAAAQILSWLAAKPPVPAGEGNDPVLLIANVYHFFRILPHKNFRLLKEIVNNEQADMEPLLRMFYKWVTLGDRCPDPEGIRPSFDVLYRYAGFFLNTMGGRAYLFRRAPMFRLLVSYYCVLILHEADKRGVNRYGIDVFPRLAPLIREISRYPDLQYQQTYISRLKEIEHYYLENRYRR